MTTQNGLNQRSEAFVIGPIGVGTPDPTNFLGQVVKNTNDFIGFKVSNTTAGTAARGFFQASSDTASFALSSFSSLYSTEAGVAGDILLNAISATNGLRLQAPATKKIFFEFGGAGSPLVTIDDNATTTSIQTGQIIKRTVPGAYPYAVLSSDYLVEVDTSAARTIQLPNAPTAGQQYVIKDVTGTASSNNISLTTVGGAVTIDGATTYTINTNYAAIKVYFNGTSYFII